ncbi:amino acid adenylation domain-containing protein [Micromonospora sp. DT233]|uniref:amino acid adenylation domain-containing protein n=1 Tax=Micromonospora sp. DT233 TaxID=3393432 RepID=UPI003CF1727A
MTTAATSPTAGATDSPYVFGERIERVVGHHARLTPDAVAVQQDERTLSYAELGAAAAAVAAGLRGHGVGEGDFVPVLLDRSPELVAVLLGVLTAGAAYIALDPAWPRERVDDVLRRAGSRLLVTDRPAHDPTPGVRQVRPDALLATPVPPGGGDGAAGRDGRAAACVFYTSGSTGRPKGVVSPHRGPIRTLVGCPTIPLSRETTFLQAAPLPWDGLSLELWAPLLNGGRCLLLGRGVQALDTEGLRGVLARGVDSMWLTSSLFNVLVEEAPELFGRLRLLLVGGERVSVAHARRVLDRFPGLHLVNGYGPAESTIFTTTHVVRPVDVAEASTEIPIGRPVPRTAVRLLDPQGRPVQAGRVGEVAVAGDGLAAGYLGDPEETRRCFVTIDGVRHYRTGDLAAADDEGNLRYRGRADRQFKINGLRMEPGEIEAAIEADPRIASCRALRLERTAGRPELGCLYTTVDGRPVDAAELRATAARTLLPAMVPTVLRHVPRLPLNANGKVDLSRAAHLLAEAADARHPAARGPAADARHPAARGPAADARRPAASPAARGPAADPDAADPALAGLLAVARDVLGLPLLAATDDYLEAGVTSLDAIRLAARVGADWGARVTVADVYRLRTVEGLLAARREFPAVEPTMPVADGPTSGPVPLTHAQMRFWMAELATPGGADNLLVQAYLLTGPLDVDALAAALRDVVLRHRALRTVYPWVGETPEQRVLPDDEVALTLEQVAAPAGDDPAATAALLTEQWWRTPFLLDEELPIRARLGRLDDRRHLLCLQIHHIAFDGWSEAILIRDLAVAYRARRTGEAPAFAPGLAYGDYSRWERRLLDRWRTEELPFWREALARVPAAFLPAPGGAQEVRRVESVLPVDAERVDRLNRVARAHGGPPVSALLAATGRALARTFDVADVTLGTVTTGRFDPALDPIVGYFVNPLVVPIRGARDLPPADLLGAVAATTVRALAHGRLPFDELVRVLRPDRQRHPWFQVFSVLQQPPPRGELAAGLTVESVRVPQPTTAEELLIHAVPQPDSSWDVLMLRRADGMGHDQAEQLLVAVDRALRELTAGT